jgi:hypothetical protein
MLGAPGAEVEELAVDLRGDGGDQSGQPRRSEQLAVNERRVIDGEEEASKSAGLHHLDVDPLGEDRPATDESLVARLRQQRLTDGEENDHHGDTDPVPGQQERRAPGAMPEIPQGEESRHPTTCPSRM